MVVVGGLATPFSNGLPPGRYQANTSVTLDIQDQAGIDRTCQPLFGRPPPGQKTDACQFGRRVVAPNPCSFPKTETYARLLCHELGHANGWSKLHEGADEVMNAGATVRGSGAQSGRAPGF